MNTGKTLFAQLMDLLPWSTFERLVVRYRGNHRIRTLTCAEQYRAMAFAQLTYRESLRDIETCLEAQSGKLYAMGFRSTVRRSTLADANETRDWRIHAELAQRLIAQARRLYFDDDLGLDLKSPVFALDLIVPEAGAIYVMDRGYTDYARLYALHQAGAFFVIRPRKNMVARRVYSAASDRANGIICDQTIVVASDYGSARYPEQMRRIRFKDAETGKTLVFITNQRTLPAATICALYKSRWQVELFFKWIKQHLRIKRFFGTSENAVKTQIWIAISVYVLVAIVKKRLQLEASLYTLLQVFSLTLFEKVPILQALSHDAASIEDEAVDNQLKLFES